MAALEAGGFDNRGARSSRANVSMRPRTKAVTHHNDMSCTNRPMGPGILIRQVFSAVSWATYGGAEDVHAEGSIVLPHRSSSRSVGGSSSNAAVSGFMLRERVTMLIVIQLKKLLICRASPAP